MRNSWFNESGHVTAAFVYINGSDGRVPPVKLEGWWYIALSNPFIPQFSVAARYMGVFHYNWRAAQMSFR